MKCIIAIIITTLTTYGQWGSHATTKPFGVTNISITEAAEDNIPSLTFLSVGYEESNYAYSGTVEDVSGTRLTLNDLDGGETAENPYEENQLTQYPHYLRLRDATKSEYNGRIFPLLGNSGNTVTINIEPSTVSDIFTVNDSIDIVRANTLESIFGTSDIFPGAKGTSSKADNIIVWNSTGWKTYFCNDSNWQTFGTRANQNKTIIYPDEGIVYARKSVEPLTLSFSGVSPTIVQTYIPGPGYKFLMANPFPREMKLSQLIDTSTGWEKSQNISECDLVLYWSGNTWITYYYDINNWRNNITGEIEDRVIQPSESIFLIKNNISTNSYYNQLTIDTN